MTPSRLVIITDLDGTLLDQESYSYEASLPAVRKLLSRKIPLVLCSSKTRAEIVLLWQELALKDPFISENGGAIYLLFRYFPFPVLGLKSKGPFEALELGTDIFLLRQALLETARSCDARVKPFGTMSLGEITTITGLRTDQAVLASQREYDEPFLVESKDPEGLFAALRKKGLEVTSGDRFHHLTGGHSKGEAVRRILNLYHRQYGSIISVGLGNSANDLPFLVQVDRPILIKNPDGSWDQQVVEKMPAIERTDGIGPNGWREAIEKILGDTGE